MFQNMVLGQIGETNSSAGMFLLVSFYQIVTGIGLGIILGVAFLLFRLCKRDLMHLKTFMLVLICFLFSIAAGLTKFA